MKKLVLFLFLLPFFAKAQVSATAQITAATNTVRLLSNTGGVIDSVAVVQKNSLSNLDMLRWNSATLKFIPRTPAQVLSDIGAAGSGATFTLGSTSIALGSTTTTLAGLTSVTSTTFTGALTGNASTATNVAVGGITGLGTGVATALAVNVGSAGAPVLFNGAGGTPSSLTGTNITGTAAGLTAGNVTTNANLTGPITSVGNATSIASQTGTGTTFVMSAGPTLTGTVTIPNLAVNNTLDFTKDQNAATRLFVTNNTSGTAARTGFDVGNSAGSLTTSVQSALYTTSYPFVQRGGTISLSSAQTGGLYIGTDSNSPVEIFTNGTARFTISGTGAATFTGAISSTVTADGILSATAAGTSRKFITLSNTGSTFNTGIESSAGGVIFTGSTAYAGVIGTSSATPFEIAAGGTVGYSMSSSLNHNFKSGTALFGGSVTVPDDAYDSGWNGDLTVPTKNAIWDAGFLTSSTNSSGTNTPSSTDVTNITSSTPGLTHYIRVGNEVTVTGMVNVTVTLGAASEVDISPPISSNFTAADDVQGVGNVNADTNFPLVITADTTNDRIKINFNGFGINSVATNLSFTYTYTIK